MVPRLRAWTSATGQWELQANTRVVVGGSEFADTARQLADDLFAESGVHMAMVAGVAPRTGDIALSGIADPSLGTEGYALTIGDHVQISANSPAGAFYATRSLLQMLRADPAHRHAHFGDARDWPQYRERAEMLDVGRKFFPLDYLKLQIRRAAWYKLNTYHFHFSDWAAFRIESQRFPGLAAKDHYTQAQIRDLVAYARRYHITIVPEIDIPAHSVVFSRFRPALALQCESMSKPHPVPWEGADKGGWTLDVTKPATREFVAQLLDEMIPLFDGPYFHVGGDEIPYDDAKAACPELVRYARDHGLRYPNDAFIEFSHWLDGEVRRHGKIMQLWQWWDFKQHYSLEPSKDIYVNEWLADPLKRAQSGYRVIGTDDGVFYECPGLRKPHPGDYCYADPGRIYDYAYGQHALLQGYKYSRWNDGAQQMSINFLDQRAQAPRQAFADRVWGGPKYASVNLLLQSAKRIGDVADDPLTATSLTPGGKGTETPLQDR
ncbi:beta-N-acetylhexosaminidase [Dyella silvatica]|uniref:beta-N-acetylhexosaminidase n=1 Tax=Dyella silvatica TaxID=2992128 RepID=UPI002253AB8D|nr:beta-N-acetylhexosaminidase [Dyella silvatica]